MVINNINILLLKNYLKLLIIHLYKHMIIKYKKMNNNY